MNRILFILSMFLVFGCSTAQRATDVSAMNISVAPYLKMDCKELATEAADLASRAESARAKTDAAYNDDEIKEAVAWVLFAPAALMLKGNSEEAAELSAIKGQVIAVREAQKINECIL
tara:strand:- start:576 stop:929 length:354 start_codon:yes stop_codon:yes gene_type:complete